MTRGALALIGLVAMSAQLAPDASLWWFGVNGAGFVLFTGAVWPYLDK
mgnify:CR=1 FL=1